MPAASPSSSPKSSSTRPVVVSKQDLSVNLSVTQKDQEDLGFTRSVSPKRLSVIDEEESSLVESPIPLLMGGPTRKTGRKVETDVIEHLYNAMKKQRDLMQVEYHKMKADCENLRLDLSHATREVVDLKVRMEALQGERDVAIAERNGFEKIVDDFGTKWEEKITICDEHAESQRQIIKNLEDSLEVQEDEKRELRGRMHTLQKEVKELKSDRSRQDEVIERLRNETNRFKLQQQGEKNKTEEIKKDYESKLQKANDEIHKLKKNLQRNTMLLKSKKDTFSGTNMTLFSSSILSQSVLGTPSMVGQAFQTGSSVNDERPSGIPQPRGTTPKRQTRRANTQSQGMQAPHSEDRKFQRDLRTYLSSEPYGYDSQPMSSSKKSARDLVPPTKQNRHSSPTRPEEQCISSATEWEKQSRYSATEWEDKKSAVEAMTTDFVGGIIELGVQHRVGIGSPSVVAPTLSIVDENSARERIDESSVPLVNEGDFMKQTDSVKKQRSATGEEHSLREAPLIEQPPSSIQKSVPLHALEPPSAKDENPTVFNIGSAEDEQSGLEQPQYPESVSRLDHSLICLDQSMMHLEQTLIDEANEIGDVYEALQVDEGDEAPERSEALECERDVESDGDEKNGEERLLEDEKDEEECFLENRRKNREAQQVMIGISMPDAVIGAPLGEHEEDPGGEDKAIASQDAECDPDDENQATLMNLHDGIYQDEDQFHEADSCLAQTATKEYFSTIETMGESEVPPPIDADVTPSAEAYHDQHRYHNQGSKETVYETQGSEETPFYQPELREETPVYQPELSGKTPVYQPEICDPLGGTIRSEHPLEIGKEQGPRPKTMIEGEMENGEEVVPNVIGELCEREDQEGYLENDGQKYDAVQEYEKNLEEVKSEAHELRQEWKDQYPESIENEDSGVGLAFAAQGQKQSSPKATHIADYGNDESNTTCEKIQEAPTIHYSSSAASFYEFGDESSPTNRKMRMSVASTNLAILPNPDEVAIGGTTTERPTETTAMPPSSPTVPTPEFTKSAAVKTSSPVRPGRTLKHLISRHKKKGSSSRKKAVKNVNANVNALESNKKNEVHDLEVDESEGGRQTNFGDGYGLQCDKNTPRKSSPPRRKNQESSKKSTDSFVLKVDIQTEVAPSKSPTGRISGGGAASESGVVAVTSALRESNAIVRDSSPMGKREVRKSGAPSSPVRKVVSEEIMITAKDKPIVDDPSRFGRPLKSPMRATPVASPLEVQVREVFDAQLASHQQQNRLLEVSQANVANAQAADAHEGVQQTGMQNAQSIQRSPILKPVFGEQVFPFRTMLRGTQVLGLGSPMPATKADDGRTPPMSAVMSMRPTPVQGSREACTVSAQSPPPIRGATSAVVNSTSVVANSSGTAAVSGSLSPVKGITMPSMQAISRSPMQLGPSPIMLSRSPLPGAANRSPLPPTAQRSPLPSNAHRSPLSNHRIPVFQTSPTSLEKMPTLEVKPVHPSVPGFRNLLRAEPAVVTITTNIKETTTNINAKPSSSQHPAVNTTIHNTNGVKQDIEGRKTSSMLSVADEGKGNTDTSDSRFYQRKKLSNGLVVSSSPTNLVRTTNPFGEGGITRVNSTANGPVVASHKINTTQGQQTITAPTEKSRLGQSSSSSYLRRTIPTNTSKLSNGSTQGNSRTNTPSRGNRASSIGSRSMLFVPSSRGNTPSHPSKSGGTPSIPVSTKTGGITKETLELHEPLLGDDFMRPGTPPMATDFQFEGIHKHSGLDTDTDSQLSKGNVGMIYNRRNSSKTLQKPSHLKQRSDYNFVSSNKPSKLVQNPTSRIQNTTSASSLGSSASSFAVGQNSKRETQVKMAQQVQKTLEENKKFLKKSDSNTALTYKMSGRGRPSPLKPTPVKAKSTTWK